MKKKEPLVITTGAPLQLVIIICCKKNKITSEEAQATSRDSRGLSPRVI